MRIFDSPLALKLFCLKK